MDQYLAEQLRQLAEQGLYRARRVVTSPQGVELQLNNQSVINFCSNDYLGLASHPNVIAAFKNAAEQFGVGSGAAHLISGHNIAHHQLEEELAAFAGRDRALLFSTGYMANMGVIAGLMRKTDSVFQDRLNHASLLDGALLSGARLKRYAHANAQHLDELLFEAHAKKLIITDGVFSMDGDVAPLPDLVKTAKDHHAWLMVDDAHGLGVLGAKGQGSLELFGLTQDDVPILMGTLGKSFGTFGAFVVGSDLLIETLIQKARTYIYTTALPAAVAEATRASLKLVIEENWRREKLQHLIAYFKRGAQQLGFPLLPSDTAIQPMMIGDNEKVMALGASLFQHGFLVGTIRPPTVPQNSARLRITLSALHEEQHIERLLDALYSVYQA